MFEKLRANFKRLSGDPLLWQSCVFNLILCACMSFFYIDSGKRVEPFIYALYFLAFVISVFFFGRKCLPVLFLVYAAGATQDTAFINCTVFFILIFMSWLFPKWKIPMFFIYALEIVVVCFRHDKTVFHLLAHFSFCIIFYFFSNLVKDKIVKQAYKDISGQIEELKLEEKEEIIVRQLAEGKLMKEITDFSKNTKSKYLHSAMERNDCKTAEELAARYAILNKQKSQE